MYIIQVQFIVLHTCANQFFLKTTILRCKRTYYIVNNFSACVNECLCLQMPYPRRAQSGVSPKRARSTYRNGRIREWKSTRTVWMKCADDASNAFIRNPRARTQIRTHKMATLAASNGVIFRTDLRNNHSVGSLLVRLASPGCGCQN